MRNWYHLNISSIPYIHEHSLQCTSIHGAFSLLFVSPCQFPLSPLLYPLQLTWNPPSCDRIRPPQSQVACKLISLVPPFTQTLPPPNSQNPNCPRLRNNPASSVRNSTEEAFAWAQYLWFSPHIDQVKRREGQEIDGRHDTLDGHGWTSSPSQTYILSYRVYNYLVSGEDAESRFLCILAIHIGWRTLEAGEGCRTKEAIVAKGHWRLNLYSRFRTAAVAVVCRTYKTVAPG